MKHNVVFVFLNCILFTQLAWPSEAESLPLEQWLEKSGALSLRQMLEKAAHESNEDIFSQLIEKKETRGEKVKRKRYLILMGYPDYDNGFSGVQEPSLGAQMCAYRGEIKDQTKIDFFEAVLKRYDGKNATDQETIQAYSNVKILNRSGLRSMHKSPLDSAIISGNVHSIKLLLEITGGNAIRHLQKGSPEYSGLPSLEKANEWIIKKLLNYSTTIPEIGKQILWSAIYYKRDDCIPAIVANITTQDLNSTISANNDTYTPLALAIRLGKIGIALALLNVEGVDLDYVDKDDNTLLHIAVKDGQEEIVKVLCEKCPDLMSKKNKQGEKPLDLAKKECKQILQKYDRSNNAVIKPAEVITPGAIESDLAVKTTLETMRWGPWITLGVVAVIVAFIFVQQKYGTGFDFTALINNLIPGRA